jgi:hypothetical protein
MQSVCKLPVLALSILLCVSGANSLESVTPALVVDRSWQSAAETPTRAELFSIVKGIREAENESAPDPQAASD